MLALAPLWLLAGAGRSGARPRAAGRPARDARREPAAEASPEGAHCLGRVVDEGERPVPGAAVEAQVAGVFEPFATTASASGAFEFAALPGTGARFAAAAPGHVQEEACAVAFDGDRERRIEIRLARGGSIAGRVLDPAGNAFPSARVRAEPDAEGGGRSAVADAEGAFAIRGLPEGAVVLRAAAPGALESAERTVALGRADLFGIDLALSPRPVVCGAVRKAGGEAARGALVLPLGGPGRGVRTGRDGSFELPVRGGGAQAVLAYAPGHAPARE